MMPRPEYSTEKQPPADGEVAIWHVEPCRRCHGVDTRAFWRGGIRVGELCATCLPDADPDELTERAARDAKRWVLMQSAEAQSRRMGIPPQYHGAALVDFAGSVQDRLLSVYDGEMPLVTLAGDPGSGKSRAMYAVVRHAWSDTFGERLPRFERWTSWCRQMHTQLFSGSEGVLDHSRDINSLCNLPWLVMIDDVLAGPPDRQAMAAFMEVVETREAWGRPTLLAMNTNLEGLSAIDDRLASRLAPGWTMMDGSDHRVGATK